MAQQRGGFPVSAGAGAGPGPSTHESKDQPREYTFHQALNIVTSPQTDFDGVLALTKGPHFSENTLISYLSQLASFPMPLIKLMIEYSLSLEQMIVAEVIQNSNHDPLVRKVNDLLNSSYGKHFCSEDSFHTAFGLACNKTYLLILIADAIYSVQSELKEQASIEDQLFSFVLDREQFKTCLRKTRWGDELKVHADKLFDLGICFGKEMSAVDLLVKREKCFGAESGRKEFICLAEYIRLICCLGDPALKPTDVNGVFPVTYGIDFFHYLFNRNERAKSLFQGFESNSLTDSDKKDIGLILKFTSSRLTFNSMNNVVFFNMNLVQVDYSNRDDSEKLLFSYDQRSRVIIELEGKRQREDSRTLRSRKVRINSNVIDLRQEATLFNTTNKPPALPSSRPFSPLFFAAISVQYTKDDKPPAGLKCG